MASHYWDNLGQNLHDTVENAVNSKNFKKLNQSVNSVIQSASKSMEKGIHKFNERKTDTYIPKSAIYASLTKTKVLDYFLAFFGYLYGFVFILSFLYLLIVSFYFMFLDPTLFISWILIGVVALAFCYMAYRGTTSLQATRRFKKYMHALKDDQFITIEDLAMACGKSEAYVVKDVKMMIDKEWFLQAHLDNNEKLLMVTHRAYKEYQEILKEDQKDIEKGITPEIREVLNMGDDFIKQIHACNDAIPNKELTSKINKMEVLVQKIFAHVEAHPESVSDIKKFLKYYLPTTLKLLQSYQELDAQPVQGENIKKSKKEIEDTLDTLNSAYEKLLDDMFQDTAWDVSSDISVLKQLLAQEGLTGNTFG